MKKFNNSESAKKKPANPKGLYATLAASFVMLGIAGYFAYSQTTDELKGQLSSVSQSEPDTTSRSESSAERVDRNQSGIAKTETSEPQSSAPEIIPPTSSESITEIPAESKIEAPKSEAETAQPFIYPAAGEITEQFSNGELVKSMTTGVWQTHNGIDISAALGDSVKAMTAGTVTEVICDALWGYCVTIDHGNGINAKYCNMNEGVTVAQGQQVSAGTVIGAVGESADAESAGEHHLHFEVTQYGNYVDPVAVIEDNR